MTDTLDDTPICVGVSKKKRFPWFVVFLIVAICTTLGFISGWIIGYTTGIGDASLIIEEIFNEIRDNTIPEGRMPW